MHSELLRIRPSIRLVAVVLGLAAVVPARAQDADTFDCIIEPNRIVEVGSAAVGVLQEVRVDRSDLVTAGQVLAVLESGVESATVNLAKLRASIDTEVHARRISYELQRSNQQRTERLHATRAVALKTRDEAEHDARVSALRVRQAKEEKRLAELELARAEQALARRTIKSPVTGVVMERHKSEGERVEDQAIMRVAELDPLRVEVVLPVDRFGSITPGMRARVVPEFGPGGEYEARVTAIDAVLDAASGTFGVRLSMPNAEHAVPGGLRCTVAFLDDPEPLPDSPMPDDEATPSQAERRVAEVPATPTPLAPDQAVVPSVDEAVPAPDMPSPDLPRVDEARGDEAQREDDAGGSAAVLAAKPAAVAMPQASDNAVTPPVDEAMPAPDMPSPDLPRDNEARGDEAQGEHKSGDTAPVPAAKPAAMAMPQAPDSADTLAAADATPVPDMPPAALPQVSEARGDEAPGEDNAGGTATVRVAEPAAIAMPQAQDHVVTPPVDEATPVADWPSPELSQVNAARGDAAHGEKQPDGAATLQAVKQAARAMSQALEVSAVPTACRTLGPIDSERVAARLRRAFAAREVEARVRAVEQEVVVNHMVTVEAAGLDGGPAAALEALVREGLNDYQVLMTDPNRISVGVFNGLRSAKGRAARVEAIGLPVKITPRTREQTRYFLDLVDLPAADDGDDLIHAVLASRRVGSPESAACPGLVTAGR